MFTKSKSGAFGHHKKNRQNTGKFLLKTGQSLEKQNEWELYTKLKSSRL
jgi:hypothetical protein